MNVKIGCDVVSISRFEEKLRNGGAGFAAKLFTPAELEGSPLERLAGIFAAKEAACKALGIPAGNWNKIEVASTPEGVPVLTLHPPHDSSGRISASISHDGDTAFAVVICQDAV